ncbi:hypothetical protein N0V93_005268 [Gnomoniopsis smithogilvyi]|uniref:Uncharacterized protein n=1 Tax=Gnomoniopsis smithogilvyi TaxID=1191159 RepID=A0A9W8YWC9_9PEZI|nr:hypothetical protein N0V93_005268 [Gnomoniopsis smithogilvyi]
MGRGGDWPPQSFAEWVVGQNFRPKQIYTDEGQKPILKIELSEDEASSEDILSVTYPGRRRRAGPFKQAAVGDSGRRVRFDGDRKPLKSALKKSSSSNSSENTLVDTSDEESATFADSSSDIDTSEDDAPVRRGRGKSKKGRVGSCKKSDHDDSSAAKDALPHPTCTCDECVKGRKILKAVIKFEAKTKVADKATENQFKERNKGQQKGKNIKSNKTNDTDGDTTDADITEDEAEPSPKGKKNKKQKQKQKTSPMEMTPSMAAKQTKKAVDKNVFKLPEYPKELRPNLIMRPEARVVQIEHALETPYDPRPNAFHDNGKGITRVYHGPKYANPNGKLYANYDAGKATPLRTPAAFPVGAMQNPYPPWFAPGAPGPVQSFAQNPAMFAQFPGNEDALKDAAGRGFGLSGLPPPSVPPYLKEMQKEMARHTDWKKGYGSEKGFKQGDAPWGNKDKNKSNSPTPNASPDAPADPPKDQNESGGWGGGSGRDNTWGAVGSGAKSNKDGPTTPHDFGAWGDSNQPETKFQRTSKSGDSQKQGSQKNWNGDNTWGANDNQTSGAWGGNNNQDTTWGTTGDTNGNGGGVGWGNNGNNNNTGWGNGSPKAASANGGNWGQSKNAATGWGAESHKVGSPRPLDSDRNETWGGPPGSFPRSAPNSRPGSNAGGGDGGWGNTSHNTNGKGSEFHHYVPKEHFEGAFDWPAGSGPPAGFNQRGHDSRRSDKSGWRGAHPAYPQFGAFNGSQRSDADPRAGDSFFHSNGGPSDWTNKPSDQATGPSNPPDWQNPDAAQNTGGKAMNW